MPIGIAPLFRAAHRRSVELSRARPCRRSVVSGASSRFRPAHTALKLRATRVLVLLPCLSNAPAHAALGGQAETVDGDITAMHAIGHASRVQGLYIVHTITLPCRRAARTPVRRAIHRAHWRQTASSGSACSTGGCRSFTAAMSMRPSNSKAHPAASGRTSLTEAATIRPAHASRNAGAVRISFRALQATPGAAPWPGAAVPLPSRRSMHRAAAKPAA